MGQRKKILSNYSFIITCGLAFIGAALAIGGLFVSKSNQVAKEALAADAVPYMAWDEDSKSVKSVEGGCSEYTKVKSTTTEWTGGWYVLNSNVSFEDSEKPITINGDVNLILMDGYTLTVNSYIALSSGNTLNIYSQSGGTGALNVPWHEFKPTAAGIGVSFNPSNQLSCGNIYIHGGNISVVGGAHSAGIGGTLYGTGGNVTVYGGKLTATGDDQAAGIGGGANAGGGNVTVYGGNIIANGGECGAGIGGGTNGAGGTINILGGTVVANGGSEAVGIGGGAYGARGSLTVDEDYTVYGDSTANPTTVRTNYADNRWQYMIVTSTATVTFNTNGGTIISGDFDVYGEGIVTPLPTNVTRTDYVFGGWYTDSALTEGPVTEISADARGNKEFWAKWKESIPYYAWDEDSKTVKPVPVGCSEFTIVESTTTDWTNGKWYVVNSEVEINDRISVSGTANLILCDNSKLTAKNGIGLSGSANINIFAQSIGENAGILIAGGENISDGFAAIGGNNEGVAGNITIHGGNIIATGGKYAAGIGAGEKASVGAITINGGAITATGGDYAAGIGGGGSSDFGSITISDQVTSLTATKGKGFYYDAYESIGRGSSNNSGSVKFCDVYNYIEVSPFIAPTITYNLDGGEFSGAAPKIYNPYAGVALPTNITKENYSFVGWYDNSALTGDPITAISSDSGNKELWAKWEKNAPVSYIERSWDSENEIVVDTPKICNDNNIVKNDITIWSNGWYVVNSNVTFNYSITVTGTVNLILCDGYTLTANNGINVSEGNSLNIYSQTNGTGEIVTHNDNYWYNYAAGIGGGEGGNGGTVTIYGGKITATGNQGGAGIGGTVTIYGGTVTANGKDGGAGISGTVTIYGGEVTATSLDDAGAGIGGGAVTISGGTVTANGGFWAAGIGGGAVTISGGTVTANGGEYGAGIGGGHYGKGGTVTISGGTVTANGGRNAAGIGGGYNAEGGTVTISGGKVFAFGGQDATGIGRGWVEYSGISNGTLTVSTTDVYKVVEIKNNNTINVLDDYATTRTQKMAVGTLAVLNLEPNGGQYTETPIGKYLEGYSSALPTSNDITRDGLDFMGWYADDKASAVGRVTAIPTDATGELTYYAKWGNYYLVGSMNDNEINEDYKLSFDSKKGEYYIYLNQLKTTDTFRIAIGNSTDGVVGTLPLLNEDPYSVTKDGAYRLYFRPEGDRTGEEWLNPYIKLQECIPYYAWDGEAMKEVPGGCADFTILDNTMTSLENGKWYVVNSNVNIDDRITVTGTVNLILCDGYTLTASNGIKVISGNTLNIFGQANGTGALIATTNSSNAAIGGNFDNQNNAGTVNIHGGKITATCEVDGAGIGGGGNGNGGTVTINGGNVTATSFGAGAGIGGGYNGKGGTVTINGGTVTANGGVCGAGIGGGFYGEGGTVTINGGNVTASSFSDGAGIGGGSEANGGTVTINGGKVFAKGSTGIGKGNIGSSDGTLNIATGKGFIVCDGTTIYAIDDSFPRSQYMAVTVSSPVTFNTYGGTINTGSYTQYPEGVPYLLPTDVTKDNYDFAGWYDNADFTGKIYTTIPADATGAKEYYARWGSFYLVGNMTNWEIDPQYKLTLNSESSTLEYTIDIPLKTADSFKIVFGSTDAIDQWYPAGEDNAYGEITFDSIYRIHFRPNGDGEGWFYNVIYVQSPTLLVGDTKYFTLKEAYEAVSENGTIKLIDDINLSSEAYDYLIIDKDFTLDLNGHILDITSDIDYKYKIKLADGKVLTIDDSSAYVGGVKGMCGVDESYLVLKNARLSLDANVIKSLSDINKIPTGYIIVNISNDPDGFKSIVRPMNDQDYADEVDALIAQIGTVEYTPESFNLIKEARDAYKALTEDQQVLVSKLDVLVASEEAYADLATAYINNKLNIQTITLDNKDDIVAARTAYNALTDEEKADVPIETLNKLLAAEKEIKDIEESNASIALIEDLPEVGVLTLDDKEEVETARAAYEALSIEAKAKVSSTVLDKLLAAEQDIKDIENSNVVKASIEALPSLDDLTVDDKELVYGVQVAYETLSTAAKAKISSQYVDKLQQTYAKVKEVVDIKESSEVTELIKDLPDVSKVTLDNKDAIDQAREEYRGLSIEGKDMISEEDLIKLVELEKAIDGILAPANVNKAIDELPSLDELTLDDKDAVLAAEKAYDKLSPEGKKGVPEEKAAKVEAAVERIAQLEKEKEEQDVEDFVSLVESLPSPENITLDDGEKINQIYAMLKRFNREQRQQISQEITNKLDLAYETFETLQKQAQIGRTWYVGYSYDWITGFFNRPNDSIVAIRDHTLVSINVLSGNTYRFTFSGKNSSGQTQIFNFDFEVESGKVPTGLRIISGAGDWDEETAYNFGVVYEQKPVVSTNTISLEIEESINHVVGRVVTINAIFDPVFATDQGVKWSVSGNGVILYEDKNCTVLVSEDTTQKTVYAKFVAAGEYDIMATARNDESIQGVLTVDITENDPIIGRKWFIGDSFEANSSFWYRYDSGYGSNLANKDLNGAILVSIYNTQGYNTCYFIYEKSKGGTDDFSLDVANPEILPTGLTFVSGDGTHDNPYVVNAIYDEAPFVVVKDIDLSVSTIQYAFVEGQVAILDASINPHYAFNQNVIWTVSSDSVVLYEDFECTTPLTNGITDIHTVYAKAEKAGEAIVYVKSADNGAANAAYVVDVIAKEGLVPFEYTLWTTQYHTWSNAYLEVRDADTGEAVARLTLTGDRDREDYLDQDHNKWGSSDTIYLPFGKNYELVWSKTPYDGGWDDKYYYFTFFNPTTIDLIADTTDISCALFEQNQVVATFLSTTVPVVRIELSDEPLSMFKDGASASVVPVVKPGAIEDKTLTWSINKSGIVELYSDENCTIALPAVIDSNTTVYVKGLKAGVATIAFTSVEDHSKVVYCVVVVHDNNAYTTYKYQLSDSYGDGWNGAELSFRNKATGIIAATLTMTNDDPNIVNGELMLLQGEYELVWKKGGCDYECSFIIFDKDDTELFNSASTSLQEGVIGEIGEPADDEAVANEVIEFINSLLEVKDIDLSEKDEILLVREFYEELTPEQKELISSDVLAKLLAAEKEINDIETSMAVDQLINELPAFKDIVLDDKDQIMATKEAYDALSDEAKAKLPKEDVEALNAAVKEINDIEESNASIEEINELPAVGELTLDDKDAVTKARMDYDALSDEAKAKVDPEVLDKLEKAEAEINDIEAAKETSDMINALPVVGVLTLEDKADVEAAKAAYDALTDYQKGKVSIEDVAKLNAAVKEINDIEAAKAAGELIDELPSLDDITGMDEKDVDAAQAAIDALTPEAIAKLSDEELAKLEEAKAAIAEIKSIVVTEDSGNKSFVRDVDSKDAEEGVNVKQTFKTAANDEAKTKELTIKAGDVAVSFDANAVNEIGNKASTFSVKVTYLEQGPEAIVDVSLNGVKFDTGISTVSFKYNKSIPLGMQAAVRYVDAEGNKTTMKAWMENGVMFFETNHFSSFIVEYELSAGAIALIIVGSILAFLLLVGIVLFILNRMHVIHIAFIDRLFDKKSKEEQPAEQVQENEASNEENEEVVTVTDEKGNIFQIRFIKSFTAKLIQSPDETKKYYEVLKNYVLSYKKTNSRVSWHFDSINAGRAQVLKFAIRGKTLCVYYALNADDYADSKYKVEKVESKKFEDVPCLYRIKNDRRCEYAKELIDVVMNKLGLIKGEEQHEYYSNLPYEENAPLIARGLIKELKVQVNKPVEESVVLETKVNSDGDEVVTTKDRNGNIFEIRYIKSFTAKLSQAEQELKDYYNELKNYALSYKKANSRVSWHFDSVNVGRNQVLKFVIRGKTLCLYYALNADDYADSKYKVEKVESKKYEDVPCLYRIKNDRRCEYAKELIDIVMGNVPTEKGNDSNEDFSVPFEETKVLLEKGLIKEVKTKVETKDEKAVQSITVEEADKQMSDEKAEASIQIATDQKRRIGKKEIINIDTLSNNFDDGDEVTIEALIAKKLVPSKTGYVKLLARGTLDKKLIVCLNDYSLQAVKMIMLIGGQVKRIK